VRALIVDDEPPARRELRRLLVAHSNVEVVGEATSTLEAASQIAADPPDVVFLDIQLGSKSGMELVPSVPASTAIVFVTAFDRYAVRAFELNALDYLLKPVEPERLAVALGRVAARASAPSLTPPSSSLDTRDWLFLRDGEHAEFVAVATITHITAQGDYSSIVTSDGRDRLAHVALADWERRLPAGDFLRIHRSTIVNLGFVTRVEPEVEHRFVVHVKGAKEPLAMSRRHMARVRAILG
jgi:two-component system LytT family response regulator